MIEALLHGKLSRQQENLEDLLTSAVFGRLKLLPAHVLGAFLARAQTLQGARPLEPLASPRSVEYAFWPQLRAAGCDDTEPDVLLIVHPHAGAARRVLVEAKYRSGKSSRAGGDEEPGADVVSPGERRIRDQLAREWEHLSNLDPEGWVVYLTPSFVMPRSDLVEAQEELRARGRPPGRSAGSHGASSSDSRAPTRSSRSFAASWGGSICVRFTASSTSCVSIPTGASSSRRGG